MSNSVEELAAAQQAVPVGEGMFDKQDQPFMPAEEPNQAAEPRGSDGTLNESVDEPVEEVDMADDGSVIRENAILLHGVDDMNTRKVENFVKKYYPTATFFIEWIDDRNVNIVFDDPEDAFQALVAVTAEEEYEAPKPIEPKQLRNTKLPPIQARYSTVDDIKPSDARKRSEYYKSHGTPSWQEDRIRFGTRRSAPMRYGNADVLRPSKNKNTSGDLFPTLAPSEPARKRRSRGNRRRRGRMGDDNNEKARPASDLPDLFKDKLGARSAGAKIGKGTKPMGHKQQDSETSTAGTESVYANMEY